MGACLTAEWSRRARRPCAIMSLGRAAHSESFGGQEAMIAPGGVW